MRKIKRKIKVTTSQKIERAKKIAEDFENGRLFADPRFQRESCWKIDDQREYLENLNMGLAQGSISLCDLSSAEEWAIKMEDDATLRRLRELRGEGKTDSILDAQNRVKCLVKFFRGEVPIKGQFFDENDELVEVSSYTTYDKLPAKLQTAFRNAQMRIDRYSQPYSGPSGVNKTFVGLNSGQFPSPQDVRQAIQTPVAEIIRNLTAGFASWEGMSSTLGVKRKKDEMILNALLYTHPDYRDKSINKSVRDTFYKIGECKEQGEVDEYSENIFKRFESILSLVDELSQSLRNVTGKQLSSLDIWKLLYFSEYLVDAQVECASLDMVKATKELSIMYAVQVKNDEVQFAKDLEKFEDPSDTTVVTEPKELSYLKKQLEVPNNPQNRHNVRVKLDSYFTQVVRKCLVSDDEFDDSFEE